MAMWERLNLRHLSREPESRPKVAVFPGLPGFWLYGM